MKENKMETTNLTEMERLIQAGEVFKAEAEETFEPGKIPEEIIKAIQEGKAGEKYADHKLCSYVESTSGAWVKVGSYGFVNSGFLKGSMPNTVSMYGTF